jgi:hypothetical protein
LPPPSLRPTAVEGEGRVEPEDEAAAGDNKATRGSPNTLATPSTKSATIPAETAAEVRSRGEVAGGLALGAPAIRRSIQAAGDDMRLSTRAVPLTTARLLTCVGLLALPLTAQAAGPKYFFQVGEVKAPAGFDPGLKAFVAEAVKTELASRPLWASELGGAEGEAAIVAELKKRNLRGFDVTVRLEELKKDVKEPKPGGRLKRLSVGVRLTVFGTAIPGAKLAFSGDGEAAMEAELTEKRMEAESADMAKEASKDAIKQAVDQAEAKLALGKSAPLNESKRKKPK